MVTPSAPWRLREAPDGVADALARELGVLPVTARVLAARGLADRAQAEAFLRPQLASLRQPGSLAGFPELVARLRLAVERGECIGVFGDYDVDGITTTALLTLFLRDVGAIVLPRVASRARGYGFGELDAAEFCDAGARLIVTCDTGTSDLAAIAVARARGIDVVVIDHHRVPDSAEHPAYALLNPHRPDSLHPYRGYASVGLGFLVAAATRTALREAGWFATRPEPEVRALLDLVAVGTIADLAPLTEENRTLVKAGLVELAARRRPGLAALVRRAEVDPARRLDEIDVGWRIAPRMNAPGRLGDATPALELLLARDETSADRFAAQCDDANHRRRTLQERVLEEARADVGPTPGAAIVVARRGWPAGVVGIVAAKLAEEHRRPAAVIAIDEMTGEGRGSIRSFDGIDVYLALCAASTELIRHGGHAQAAGLSVAEERVPAFRDAFVAAVAAAPRVESRGLECDAVVSLGELEERVAVELAALGPFGQKNDAPVLLVRGARVRTAKTVGQGGAHLKLTLECEATRTSCSAIAFGFGADAPRTGASIDVAFQPEVNEFRGVRRVELKVRALRSAEPDA